MGVLSGLDCPICSDNSSSASWCATKACGHVFHVDCLNDWKGPPGTQYITCPCCRKELKRKDDRRKKTYILLHGIEERHLASSPIRGLPDDEEAGDDLPNNLLNDNADYEDVIAALQAEVEEEKEGRLQAEGKWKMREKELRTAEKKIWELQGTIEEKEEAIKGWEKGNEKLRKRVDELEASKVDLRRNLDDRKSQVERLKHSLEDVQQSKETLFTQLAESERRRRELESSNARLMEANQSYRQREAQKKQRLARQSSPNPTRDPTSSRADPVEDEAADEGERQMDVGLEEIDFDSSHFTDPPDVPTVSTLPGFSAFAGFDTASRPFERRGRAGGSGKEGEKGKEKKRKIDGFLSKGDSLALGPKRRKKI
ncbi:hypothetical protein BT69DRAFT_126557 [Atractiella rhizophila]|nr:hypothetical protein BT69DRAFT_126557 [Atractiella rhizophila]